MGAGDAVFTTVVAALVAGERDPAAALTRAMAIAAATIRSPGGLLRSPA
ncbi:hypothetical protein GTU73_11020 [Rathayibacter sp. VKM Ac-2804]|nr:MULTISPECIES: hypothetical protein [unclassified Rathayibacter]NRG42569.1 hypothetical protein [Rathayibacter sp. VKM Ac-2835]QHF24486.1 hypothetical protein GTU73_11020 [Rathayibacter sp. VKM Ac-2804]